MCNVHTVTDLTGVEETLYLLLLVAKKNRKSVDIQNNKGKVKILIKDHQYDLENFPGQIGNDQ